MFGHPDHPDHFNTLLDCENHLLYFWPRREQKTTLVYTVTSPDFVADLFDSNVPPLDKMLQKSKNVWVLLGVFFYSTYRKQYELPSWSTLACVV